MINDLPEEAIDMQHRIWQRGSFIAATIAWTMIMPSLARAETASQATATVETRAAQLGEAANEQQAIADQNLLLPAVRKALAAGARRSLLDTSRTPSVLADILRLTKPKIIHNSEGFPPVKVSKPANAPAGTAQVRAHAAAVCWNDAWGSVVEWSGIAWLYVRADGWCGNGYSMTWLGGATFAKWSWGIYCFTNYGQDYSWDLYPSWVHMADWGTLGVSYVWGCFGVSGGKPVERIAANGYWDFFNDYGW